MPITSSCTIYTYIYILFLGDRIEVPWGYGLWNEKQIELKIVVISLVGVGKRRWGTFVCVCVQIYIYNRKRHFYF